MEGTNLKNIPSIIPPIKLIKIFNFLFGVYGDLVISGRSNIEIIFLFGDIPIFLLNMKNDSKHISRVCIEISGFV